MNFRGPFIKMQLDHEIVYPLWKPGFFLQTPNIK